MPTLSMFYGLIIEIHRDELLADWDLCMNGKEPFKIKPLN